MWLSLSIWAAVTECHRLGAFLQFRDLASPGSRCWQTWCLVKTLLLVYSRLCSGCILTWLRSHHSCVFYFIRVLIPFVMIPSPWLNYFPKALPPNTTNIWVGAESAPRESNLPTYVRTKGDYYRESENAVIFASYHRCTKKYYKSIEERGFSPIYQRIVICLVQGRTQWQS